MSSSPGSFPASRDTSNASPRGCWRDWRWPRSRGETFIPPPRATALGSLIHYITHADPSHYQPANISFDLLPPMDDLPRKWRATVKRAASDNVSERWRRI